MQHGLLEQGDIAMHCCLHTHLLHAYTCRTGRCTRQWQVTYHRHIDAVLIHVPGDFDHAAMGQIGDVALVDHVKVSTIYPPDLQGLDDVCAMLFAALVCRDYTW